MAGIKEVAALAGVSTATASRALSGNGPVSAGTRARVRQAAAELNFVLSYSASSLASGRNHNIGVVVPAVERWFFGQVLSGIAGVLMESGYDLTLYNAPPADQQNVFTDFLLRQRLDAVIAVSLELNPDELDQLLAVNRPIVGIGGPMPSVPTISVDHFALAVLATEHLISLGHRRIAHISGGEDPARAFELVDRRRQGHAAAMASAGLQTRPTWLVISDFTVADAHERARHLLAQPHDRPTAIFCSSDEMAIGTILAARELGLHVPVDLSVIGIDGHELGAVFGLTTIDQRPKRQGERAAARLLLRLNGGTDAGPLNEPFETRFTVRTSTAAPPLP